MRLLRCLAHSRQLSKIRQWNNWSYDEREPIEVRVEPDRIIIVSHPGADRSISAEGLREFKAYSRRYRNRRIGEFLKEMHLTEGRNTGFRKIRNALHNNGSPEPLFETDEERTYFSTTLYIHPDFEKSKMIAHDGNDGNRDGNDGLTEIEIAVLNEIRDSPKLSAQRIADRIGVTLDPQFGGTPSDYSALEQLFASVGVPYEIRRTEIGPVVFDYRKDPDLPEPAAGAALQ